MSRSNVIAIVLSVIVILVLVMVIYVPYRAYRPRPEQSESTPVAESPWPRGAVGESGLHRKLDALAADLGEVKDELAALGAVVRGLAEKYETPGGDAAAASDREVAEGAAANVEELTVRLDELATRLESSLRPIALPVSAGLAVETEEARARIVEDGQAIALDPARLPGERLQALRELRFRDGRSYEVTLAMIGLIEDPELEPSLRADIIRNLHGVEFEELRAPLLAILANDSDPETRSETVETLEPFYGDPAVHEAIVRVRDADPDYRVRMEASRRLDEYELRQ